MNGHPQTQPLVTISHLSKSFDKTLPPALVDINAIIPKGEIVGLAGPDGAGKTTLIRLIAGLLIPTEGDVVVDGYHSVTETRAVHNLIAYMPQKFGLYEDLTVMQNLVLYADLRGTLGEQRQETFKKLLAFTGLEPFTTRLAGALSGGMKQKLGLACTLVKKPALLLLDEPSVGVDPISRRELWRMVHDLLEEGISVVWSTAYLEEAERCHSVLLLNEGKLLYSGSPKELTKRVEGRTFKLTNLGVSRRLVLSDILKLPSVIDGTIQGKDLRIVLKANENTSSLNIHALPAGEQMNLEQTPPRFEDAFIDILGGEPGGGSVLADLTPQVPAKEEAVIQAEGLVKRFGSFTAADHITFTVPSAEIFGLLGPNGAGKSTTFKMLCGLLKPTSGSAYVNGLSLEIAPSEARSHIGYMAQKFSLYGNLSVMQNLEFFSGIYNLRGKHRNSVMEEMIDIFALKPYLNESSDNLPLGFKQRLALSCALMHRPEVLFLDEPTSGVDPITRREFWNHINGLVERGVTVMVTTHFMDEAEYCDRIGLVYRSKLIMVGTPDELKEKAANSANPRPTLEDAFIDLIEKYDAAN